MLLALGLRPLERLRLFAREATGNDILLFRFSKRVFFSGSGQVCEIAGGVGQHTFRLFADFL